jgi:hypothetical protein
MNISKLLSSRQTLLRQAHLANLAYSYFTLRRLGERVIRAGLQGRVQLRAATVGEDFIPATLVALDGSQSVIEEHFLDEDVLQLADSMEFALEGPFGEVEFLLEDLATKYAAPLREALDRAGVVIDAGEMIGDESRLEE